MDIIIGNSLFYSPRKLDYRVNLEGGNPLPLWLNYDSNLNEIFGTCPFIVYDYNIEIIVNDGFNDDINFIFMISLYNNAP